MTGFTINTKRTKITKSGTKKTGLWLPLEFFVASFVSFVFVVVAPVSII